MASSSSAMPRGNSNRNIAASAAGASSSAAEAAAAAEFASKKYVWIPDKEAGYLSAWVVSEDAKGEQVTVALPDGTQRNVPAFDISRQNPPRFELSENIADLTFLSEAGVAHCLRQRYHRGLIYTYSGLFLVAVNPYHQLPIYTDSVVASYKGRRREENAPHVFAIADEAMRNMLDNRENQSLLITGESGAGKTENTKKVIQYLAAVAADMASASSQQFSGSPQSPGLTRSNSSVHSLTRSGSSRYVMDRMQGIEAVGSKQLGLLERQILQANPILEAFGNAQTIRNNNSSRFGKFVRIEFTSVGAIAGANIDWYLLEKSRVHNRSDKERSFHVFYQLLRSGDSKLLSSLLLSGNPADYSYLKSTRQNVEGLDDGLEWKSLCAALDTVGFTKEEQTNFFRVVASILLIGNIDLADDRSGAEQARINNAAHVEKVCHLLGVPEQELTRALLRPRVKAGREWVVQSRTRKQVVDEMAALCKTMYEKTFGAIVERINQALDRPTSKSTFIGVLDIAGFEIFESNSFEQLCINYTNEKLQQFFNHHMFVLEQEEYARENIEWDFVNFGLDLQPTIDLIESTTPIGILSCLDEECIMPKASDHTFTEKCNKIWATNKDGSAKDEVAAAAAAERGVAHGSTKYIPARFSTGFTIKHYAGNVEYSTEGWLDKNKDPLNDNLTRVMSESSDRFIASLFAEFAPEDDYVPAATGSVQPMAPKRRAKRGAFRTLAQKHKEQLTSLMNQLGSTQPHFVRCIVPNGEKKPGKMHLPQVLEQLRCNGVLEGIRIARLGYPNRLLFNEFRTRYEVLTPDIIPRGYMDGRKACQRMVEAMDLDRDVFKIGLTKIFFKAGVLAELEERRDALLYDIFARFQAACRMFTARRQMKKILNRAAAVRTIQRNARVYVELREWPWWQLYTKVRPLLTATRHDEELKKREQELLLANERAERDQKEREALEALRFNLQNEKAKVEEQLASERALLSDKDELLTRSKAREASLEEEFTGMQSEMEKLETRLEQMVAALKDAEAARDEHKTSGQRALEKLGALEAAEKEWKSRETTLTSDLGTHTSKNQTLLAERDSLAAAKTDLERQVKERREDFDRHQKRHTTRISELEGLLATEQGSSRDAAKKAAKLEEDLRSLDYQLSEQKRTFTSTEGEVKERDAKIAALTSELASVKSSKDAITKEHGDLKIKLETLSADLSSAKSDAQRASESRSQLQKELDETRKLVDAKTSEDVKQKELQRRKEEEVKALRTEMERLQQASDAARHESAEQINSLNAKLATVTKQHSESTSAHRDASAKLSSHEKRLAETVASLTAVEQSKRAVENELKAFRDRATAAESSIESHKRAKTAAEEALAAAQADSQQLEDAMLEMERSSQTWQDKHAKTSAKLAAETKLREEVEAAIRQHERNVKTLQSQLTAKEREFNKLSDELHLTTQDLKKAQSMSNKTIVEHVHVYEQAKKMAERQLDDAKIDLSEKSSIIKSLEKIKSRLTTDNEDLQREIKRLVRDGGGDGTRSAGTVTYGNISSSSSSANGHHSAGSSKDASRAADSKINELNSAVQKAKRERDEAQSALRRRDIAFESTREKYENKIQELERQLKGSQMAHSNTYQNLQDLVASPTNSSNGGSDSPLRRHLLEELRLGHDALEADIAAKSEMLRSHKVNGQSSTSSSSASPRSAASPPPGQQSRPSWASDANAHAYATRNGTTVVTPSSMKRGSIDVSSSQQAQKALIEDNHRLERKLKEMEIEMASLSQNAADSEGRSSYYKDKVRDVQQELVRVQMYAQELEQQLHGGGQSAAAARGGRKPLPSAPMRAQ
ncbi:unnamed protein product [Sympodiomycopsis kandeliae]